MENNLNKLLLRQIKRHFGSADNVPDQLKGILEDINNTYENFEDDTQLLQNSIEISSQELRDAYQKHKLDADTQNETINKIKEAIYVLNPLDQVNINESESSASDTSYLFDSLIRMIEERKHSEEEILKLSKAVEQNPASIVITDLKGDIEYVNPKFCDLTGYRKEEVIGRNPRILKSESTSPEYFRELWKTILSGHEWRGELHNKKKNGELYWESALISPIINENQKITHFIAIKEDITERKRAEAERVRQAGLITSLLDSIPDIIFFKDTNGVYLGCNPPFAEFAGKSKDEIIGKTDYDLFDKETATLFRSFDNEMLQQKQSRHDEEWITYPDGRKKLIDTLKTPYWASDGSLIGILGISRDITVRKEAEEALQQSSKKFEAIISASPDGIGITALDGKIKFVSDKLALMYDFPIEQKNLIIDQSIFNFTDPSNHENLKTNIIKLLSSKGGSNITEYLTVRKDNSRIFADVNSTVLYDAKGKPESILFIQRDVTKRKQAEEALSNERALFRTIIDLIPDAVYVKDLEGRKILANPKEVQFAGKNSENEIIGQTDFNLYSDVASNRALAEDQLVLNTGTPIMDNEGTLIDKEGISHWILVSKVPLRDIHGKITGLVGVTRDISARKTIEEKLRESEANFRTFFESMDDMIFVANLEGVIFFVNSSVSRKLGYPMDALHGMDVLDLQPTQKRHELQQILGKLQAGNMETSFLPLVRKDGTFIPVETHVWLGKWDGNDAIFGLSKDLSKELESLQKFNKVFDNNPAPMAIGSIPENVFLDVNQAFLANTGFSREEAIGKTATQLGMFLQPGEHFKMTAELEKIGFIRNRELKLKAKSGAIMDCLFSGEMMESLGEKYFLTVMVDITESKKLEEAIKLQNDFYNIASKVTERLIQTDSDQLDLEINHSLEILGIFNQVGRTNIFSLDPETDQISNTFEWCAEGIKSHMDDIQNITFSFIPRWQDAFLRNEHICIESVSNLPDELRLEKEIFEPQGILSLLAVPMYYGTSLIGFVSFDSVTEEKHWNDQVIILLKIYASVLAGVIYKKRTEAALVNAKLTADIASKAKSEFLANMSHEIRTPLNGVIGFTDLLLKTPLNKIQQQYAENVNTSGFSLLGIINDILDFSKIEAGKMELDFIRTDIIELVEQTSDIIKYHASQKGLELLLNIQVDLPRFIVADSTRLKQILVNLLGNAIKFTASGEVELKISFTRTDEITGKFTFSVRDTGIGINEEQQKKLFKAFSQADTSTTRKFGGTGLGLAISNMLAEKMGSKIEIISQPGKGATFFFTIETEYEAGEKLEPGSLTGINRILVIDDNDNNRMILEHTFINWGIEFTGIDNGLSALKLIEKSQAFDVIIVDYHMPFLNGIDTIKMIRGQLDLSAEKQPVILLHSSSDDIGIYDECKRLGVRFNLTKPVKSQELLQYLKNIHTQPVLTVKDRENASVISSAILTNDFSPVILVAEDVFLNMVLVTTIVKQMVPNVTILEAKNGIEAFETAIDKNPDLVLMDVQMPEMSGIEATVKIRNYENGKESHIPIIALTAGAIKGEKEKCLEAGMDDFLTKPIDQVSLRRILEKYLIDGNHQAEIQTVGVSSRNIDLHFDKNTFMENVGNSQSIFNELIEFVPEQFAADFAMLEKAVKEQNLADFKKAVHSIKGASLNMCFIQLAELAKEIELNIDETPVENFNLPFNDMASEWRQIQLILKGLDA